MQDNSVSRHLSKDTDIPSRIERYIQTHKTQIATFQLTSTPLVSALPVQKMNGSSFLTPAVSCVQALQACSVAQAELFQNPRNTSLASAISMLSHTAQLIESAVQCDDNLHGIGIFIACRVKKHSQSVSDKDPTFLLWNSMRNTSNSQNTMLEANNSPPRLSSNPPRHAPRLSVPDSSGIYSKPSHSLERVNALQISGSNRTSNSIQPPPSNPQQITEEDKSYSVPVTIAAKCLELLLDGSGFSSHRSIFQKRSYTELGTKPLVDAVKEVFKAEQKVRMSAKDYPAPTLNAPAKDEMIYCDLLPDHLRKANGKNAVMVSVPEVVLEDVGNVTIPQYLKVSMDIRKPDRNKKRQNFAILCVLLEHTGPTGVCAKTLHEWARLGFTAEGCKRRMKYTSSSKVSCSSSSASCLENKASCSFMLSSEEMPIGTGSVDPFTTVFDAKQIESNNMVVRFANVKALEDITFPPDLTTERKRSMHRCWKNGERTLWPKAQIKRIELLGDYRKPIGTAIFVQHLIPSDPHQYILRRIKRACNSKRNSLEVTNAIVVCDIQLTVTNDTNAPKYPYMEWYSLSCFKMLHNLHFGGKDPPKILEESFLQSAKALLWNKNHYRLLD